MFGYMGFGMQSWIYKRSPRKPFEKRERITSITSLPKYDKSFELKYREDDQKRRYGLLTILIVCILILLTSILVFHFKTYSSEHSKLVNERVSVENRQAFDYLLNSGYNRMKSNNLEGAYSEFILAYDIDGNSQELNTLIIETLSMLCEKDSKFCTQLDEFLQKF